MDGEWYEFANSTLTMKREAEWPWRWLLLDGDKQVDRDQYRHDLIERHRLKVLQHHDPRREARHG